MLFNRFSIHCRLRLFTVCFAVFLSLQTSSLVSSLNTHTRQGELESLMERFSHSWRVCCVCLDFYLIRGQARMLHYVVVLVKLLMNFNFPFSVCWAQPIKGENNFPNDFHSSTFFLQFTKREREIARLWYEIKSKLFAARQPSTEPCVLLLNSE